MLVANVRFLAGYRRPGIPPDDVASAVLDDVRPGERLGGLLDRLERAWPRPAAKAAVLRPLAIGMLGRQLAHPAWTTAGPTGERAAAMDRLKLMHAENLSVAAEFGLSCRDPDRRPAAIVPPAGRAPGPTSTPTPPRRWMAPPRARRAAYRDTGDRTSQADALVIWVPCSGLADDYPAAIATLRQALALSRCARATPGLNRMLSSTPANPWPGP